MYTYEHRLAKFHDFEEKVMENNKNEDRPQKILYVATEDFRGMKAAIKINSGELTVRPVDFGWELEVWREYSVYEETQLIKVKSNDPEQVVGWIHDYLAEFHRS